MRAVSEVCEIVTARVPTALHEGIHLGEDPTLVIVPHHTPPAVHRPIFGQCVGRSRLAGAWQLAGSQRQTETGQDGKEDGRTGRFRGKNRRKGGREGGRDCKRKERDS
eukprot:3932372-Rhodomonas_salina.3